MQVTYPLDTLRLRIAVDPSMRGIRGASTALFREGSYNAFFRGLTASLIGTAPELLLARTVLHCQASKAKGEKLVPHLAALKMAAKESLYCNDTASDPCSA